MFSRALGDIEKMFSKLPRLPTVTVLDRIRTGTKVNETRFDLTDKERYHNSLIEFQFFAKKVLV